MQVEDVLLIEQSGLSAIEQSNRKMIAVSRKSNSRRRPEVEQVDDRPASRTRWRIVLQVEQVAVVIQGSQQFEQVEDRTAIRTSEDRPASRTRSSASRTIEQVGDRPEVEQQWDRPASATSGGSSASRTSGGCPASRTSEIVLRTMEIVLQVKQVEDRNSNSNNGKESCKSTIEDRSSCNSNSRGPSCKSNNQNNAEDLQPSRTNRGMLFRPRRRVAFKTLGDGDPEKKPTMEGPQDQPLRTGSRVGKQPPAVVNQRLQISATVQVLTPFLESQNCGDRLQVPQPLQDTYRPAEAKSSTAATRWRGKSAAKDLHTELDAAGWGRERMLDVYLSEDCPANLNNRTSRGSSASRTIEQSNNRTSEIVLQVEQSNNRTSGWIVCKSNKWRSSCKSNNRTIEQVRDRHTSNKNKSRTVLQSTNRTRPRIVATNVSVDFSLNAFPHTLQLCGRSPVLTFLLNALPHTLQLCGRSPVCCFWLNALLHTLQLCRRSPVLDLWLNSLPHTLQLCGRSPVCRFWLNVLLHTLQLCGRSPMCCFWLNALLHTLQLCGRSPVCVEFFAECFTAHAAAVRAFSSVNAHMRCEC
ncbi:Protein of unknown function [Gryllus bimaculatus]|nr:Protein of unknown function [Gryllus bimaculatus]